MHYEFLPPYSPDYNPIELLFSAMKYRLRRDGAYIWFAMNRLSEQEINCILIKEACNVTLQAYDSTRSGTIRSTGCAFNKKATNQ